MSMGYGPNCVAGAATIVHLSDGFEDAMQGRKLQVYVRERRAQRAARDSWTSPRDRDHRGAPIACPWRLKRGYEPGQCADLVER